MITWNLANISPCITYNEHSHIVPISTKHHISVLLSPIRRYTIVHPYILACCHIDTNINIFVASFLRDNLCGLNKEDIETHSMQIYSNAIFCALTKKWKHILLLFRCVALEIETQMSLLHIV